MTEPHTPYTTPTRPISGVTYIDDVPDVREYLMNLRRYFIDKERWAADVLISLDFQRDFHRKVRELDELIARIPQDKP